VLAAHDLLTCQAVLAELARILANKFHMPAELVEAHGAPIGFRCQSAILSA